MFLLSLFIRPKLRKTESALNDSKMTLNATRLRYPIYVELLSASSKFHSMIARFKIIIVEVFDFSIGYNGEFEILEKLKLEI